MLVQAACCGAQYTSTLGAYSVATTVAKRSVFIATSLDGFISRTDGSIDWLDQANTRVPKGEDCGYEEFMSTVDALVMGRHTFELAKSFGRMAVRANTGIRTQQPHDLVAS